MPRQNDRFKFLVAAGENSSALMALEKRLAAVPCRYKHAKGKEAGTVRVMVATRDFDFAFRVMLEWAASETALRPPVAGG